MKILVLDKCIQAEMDDALRTMGHKVLHILNLPKLEDHIRKYKPDMVLIGSNPETYDSLELLMGIKDRHVHLPVLIYDSTLDNYIKDLLPLVATTLSGVPIYKTPFKRDHMGPHPKMHMNTRPRPFRTMN